MPKVGDFGLTRGDSLAMWFIRLGTFSRYGHAAVVVDFDSNGCPIVVEAMPDGARMRKARPGEFVWSDVPLTDEQRHIIRDRALSAIGIGYDWPSIFLFVLRFFGARIHGMSDDHADDKMICSELVMWAYREADMDLYPGVAPGDVSPGDLADYLVRH